jgi:hypothetical protein
MGETRRKFDAGFREGVVQITDCWIGSPMAPPGVD